MDASPLDPRPPGTDQPEAGSADVAAPDDAAADVVAPAPLPRPPEAFDPPALLPGRPQRAGELTVGWRTVYAIGWIGVVLGLAAVWKSSRTLGLPVWWLGPEADPNPLPLQILPFLPAALLIAAAVRSMRFLPWLGLAGAAAMIAIAAFDVGRFTGLALIQIVLAVAGALVSVAAFAGVLLRAD